MVHFPRWQVILILIVCLGGVAFAVPNLIPKATLSSAPNWLPHQQMNLGLDLRGGAHLLWQADLESVVARRMEGIESVVREELRSNKIRFARLRAAKDSVRFSVRDLAQADKAKSLVNRQINSGSGLGGLLGGGQEYAVEADDAGNFRIALTDAGKRALFDRTIEQTIEVIRKRVDPTGTTEPVIQRQGEDRILLQVPGEKNPERLKRLVGKTALLTFHPVDEDARNTPDEKPKPGYELLKYQKNPNVKPTPPDRYLMVRRRPELTGENLVSAEQGFRDGSIPVVNFRLDGSGARKFARWTQANVGKRFAIVLDNEVISAPVVRSAILGGSGEISGGFTVQSAQDLALLLRAGALPAKLTVIEERSVGPSLGADSIEAGKIAAVIGMILVVVFMVVAYGLFGILADIALVVNLILIGALLSLLQATLTLPGIAGIVLTIGMAVDANVLIFERIREEVRAGRTPISAIDAGYRRALTTIVDSNLTTFIAAVLLFLFGSGPVQGFAVTLSIGLATSMFTAIMVTRLFISMWLRRRRPAALPI
jgi:preprotein translocase subunit SecD